MVTVNGPGTYRVTFVNDGGALHDLTFDDGTVIKAEAHATATGSVTVHQVPMGLLGAFIVDDPAEPKANIDYTMILNDGPLGFTLNGKEFPATEPIVAKKGQTVLVRYMNEGLQIHPMHLHGLAQEIIALDCSRSPTLRTR
jgi:FtsP/CotA-like multicopper oxidase with cupredoxin domain